MGRDRYITIYYDSCLQDPFKYGETTSSTIPLNYKNHTVSHADKIGWKCLDVQQNKLVKCSIQFAPLDTPDCPFKQGQCTLPIDIDDTPL